jgi:imidazolonepropionase-like amidohydrolase
MRLAHMGRLGARADLVLVDGNPLADIKATRAIVRVFKNGFYVRRAPAETAPPPAW